MILSLDYATLLQYSPKGTTEVCISSRKVRDAIKAGRINQFKARFSQIIIEYKNQLAPFLAENVTLIPIPRSSPIRESDLWPSMEIATLLASLNYGTVSTSLQRHTAVRKSAFSNKAVDRTSVEEHFNSFAVKDTIPSHHITLVDDILTQGRTSIAAASRLADKFPNATIRLFCVLRAKGLDKEIDKILNVNTDKITFNPATGKSHLNP